MKIVKIAQGIDPNDPVEQIYEQQRQESDLRKEVDTALRTFYKKAILNGTRSDYGTVYNHLMGLGYDMDLVKDVMAKTGFKESVSVSVYVCVSVVCVPVSVYV